MLQEATVTQSFNRIKLCGFICRKHAENNTNEHTEKHAPHTTCQDMSDGQPAMAETSAAPPYPIPIPISPPISVNTTDSIKTESESAPRRTE